MPLSAIAGRADVMEVVADGRVRHVGTFNCAPPAAAAAVAALDLYRLGAPELYDELERIAGLLASGLAEAAAGAGVPLKLHQAGPLLQTFILDPELPVASYADAARADAAGFARFAEQMLGHGVVVLPRGWWFISTEHTEDDVELTLEAARASFAEIASDVRGAVS